MFLYSKLHANPFQPVMPPVDALELDAESMLECMTEFTSSKSLRPIYDSGLLAWLLQHAEHPLGQRAVKAVLVKSKANQVLGWYIYRLSKSGISEVLQLFADKGQSARCPEPSRLPCGVPWRARVARPLRAHAGGSVVDGALALPVGSLGAGSLAPSLLARVIPVGRRVLLTPRWRVVFAILFSRLKPDLTSCCNAVKASGRL